MMPFFFSFDLWSGAHFKEKKHEDVDYSIEGYFQAQPKKILGADI